MVLADILFYFITTCSILLTLIYGNSADSGPVGDALIPSKWLGALNRAGAFSRINTVYIMYCRYAISGCKYRNE